jgi:hypothetical protein
VAPRSFRYRPLLIYFRDSDLYSTAQFEPGVSENWVNTLFYDPCLSGESGCTSGPSVTETINGTTYTAGTQANWYGPDGAPFIDAAGNRALLVDSGITPVDTDGPWADVSAACGRRPDRDQPRRRSPSAAPDPHPDEQLTLLMPGGSPPLLQQGEGFSAARPEIPRRGSNPAKKYL